MTDAPRHRLEGVFAAALTPLQDDLSPDHGAMLAHYRWLLANGCDGLAVLGTTGEANSFTLEERLGIIEALGESNIDPSKFVIGTGCCAVADTVRLTRAALEIDAAGVLMLPPFYYKGVSDDGLFAAYAQVIEQTGSDRLAIYLYHFPRMTGLELGLALIERLVASYPRTVIGLKDSSGDWSNTESVCRAIPGFGVFAGSEEFLLPVLKAGGAGCISATTNVTCGLTADLYRRWRSADAEALQEEVTRVRLMFQQAPLVPALKQILAHTRGEPGWLNIRPPLAPLDREQAEPLIAELEDAGFSLPAAA